MNNFKSQVVSEENAFIPGRNNRAAIAFDKDLWKGQRGSIWSSNDVLLDGALVEEGRLAFRPEVSLGLCVSDHIAHCFCTVLNRITTVPPLKP